MHDRVERDGVIVANKNSKLYHRSYCAYARQIWGPHVIEFASSEAATNAEYKYCGQCFPQKKFVTAHHMSSIHFKSCPMMRNAKYRDLRVFGRLREAVEADLDTLCDQAYCTMKVPGIEEWIRILIDHRDQI